MGKNRRKPVRQKGKMKRFTESMYNNGSIFNIGTRGMPQIQPQSRPVMHVKRMIAIDQNKWQRKIYEPNSKPLPTFTIKQKITAVFCNEHWHEIVVRQDQFRKLALCFFGSRAMWVEVEYSVKKVRFSHIFASSASAIRSHNMGRYDWRPYVSYTDSNSD